VASHRKHGKVETRAREHAREHAPVHTPELPELDRLIHERIRLGIVSALATNDSLSFNDLKRVLKTTDGNLSVHARKLEEAEYISCVKFFEGRVPRTEYRLTAKGRAALAEYLDQMEEWIRVTRESWVSFFEVLHSTLPSTLLREHPLNEANPNGREQRVDLKDAARFWERQRFWYNGVLLAVVVLWVALTWPHFRPALSFVALGKMAVLAVLANLCYCAGYAMEGFIQPLVEQIYWRRLRWTVWTAGVLLAILLSNYWIADEIYPDYRVAEATLFHRVLRS
jgi:DNA-binding HxlR family transcriptional regulator